MGQLNETARDERFNKICGEELMHVLNEEGSESIKRWMKYLFKKFRDPQEQWSAVGIAIGNVENWGRYRCMMELAINQIEIAQDIKTKAMQADLMGSQTLVSINSILADSYLSLAR